jgi:repressor LexA
MNEGITPKQKKVLTAIRTIQHIEGKTPTLEELRKYLQYATVSSVQRHVDALKAKGYLTGDKHQSRTLHVTHQHLASIPLVGNVACGTPLLAEENVEAYISYDADKLHSSTDDYFFLRAAGDSMNRANIDSGDLVLVRKAVVAESGKRIVALVGDDATIKKLDRHNGHWILQPESTNPAHKPLIMLEDFSIQGVVADVVKGVRI